MKMSPIYTDFSCCSFTQFNIHCEFKVSLQSTEDQRRSIIFLTPISEDYNL